jgi:hypothetical protein
VPSWLDTSVIASISGKKTVGLNLTVRVGKCKFLKSKQLWLSWLLFNKNAVVHVNQLKFDNLKTPILKILNLLLSIAALPTKWYRLQTAERRLELMGYEIESRQVIGW